MAGKRILGEAKKNKNDEFYTQLSEIEKELKHYRDHFKDKVVFCNCDDPFESNFFKYFAMNFNFLGLKKLICTCYAGSPVAYTELDDLLLFKKQKTEKMPYMIEINEVKDLNGDGAEDMADIEMLLRNNNNTLTILDGDGDFRSEESVGFLQEADIVVTNPPFSLFREYIEQLLNNEKKFIVIGNNNALTYLDIFKHIKENKMWLGYEANKTMEFRLNDCYKKWNRIENGVKIGKVPAISWFTNVDINKRHEELILYSKFVPEQYPKYDNYDAIEVDRVSRIPCDYYEKMGVPITFLNNYNPDQFEIIGLAITNAGKSIGVKNYDRKYKTPASRDGTVYYVRDGKGIVPYARVIIKRKVKNEN